MLFGSHISAAGGVTKAPERAAEVGCEVFQFFSRSPQGGSAPKLTAQVVEAFKKHCLNYNQLETYIHAPYYINFASAKVSIRHSSASIIRQELERGSLLGVKYVMAHLGSFKDVSDKKGLQYVVKGLTKMLTDYKGSTEFLIEISAGAGKVIGDSFEEVASIIHQVEKDRKVKSTIGVCFDTCHAFASGYDLRTKQSVKKVLDSFNHIIGLDKLRIIHINDSKHDLNSHKDQHEHLGKGKIGLAGFKALVQDRRLKNVNMILETPKNEAGDDPRNLAILKKFRRK
ncbi:deoxyribonuclease IV [Patescibacteria group bacterium]|nr:deoxyribonuclease IV [Patescibacteria group bacterium]